MKFQKNIVQLVVVCAVGFLAHCVAAEGAAMLTPAQWKAQLGAAAESRSVLQTTLTQISPEDKVDFTKSLLKAINSMPVDPKKKAAAFVTAALECIKSCTGESRIKVIAEVFADIPVEYLPVVSDVLGKRFNQEFNKLSTTDYENVAREIVAAAIERNRKTDEPSVRDTFVIATFIRGATDQAAMEKMLLDVLPPDQKSVIKDLVEPTLKETNYETLLAAAGVEPIGVPSETFNNFVKDDMRPIDINVIPRGYPNQK